jgi:uncharacterized protein YycO
MSKRNKLLMTLFTAFIVGLIIIIKYYKNPFSIINTSKLSNSDLSEIHNADIIFQTSVAQQSQAIQLATKSKYSHCGIIYKNGNDYFVFEAVQPVKLTPLGEWIDRGQNGHFVIKRLKNAARVLNSKSIEKMKNEGAKFKNKNYDYTFEWNDDKIYCSELIWKIYKRAIGIEIGKLEKLKDFDITNNEVKKKLKERYGNKIPLNETVISPAAIFNSNLLYTVISN